MSIPTKLLSYQNLLSNISSHWTVSPDEGQGPEGYNMAMGGASCTHTRPATRWPPCRRSRPPASGGPQGKGVLRQMVQHVLLALFLGPGTAGQRLFFFFRSPSSPFYVQTPCRTLTQACRWSSVGAQLSGDVPQLPEKDGHGRAATCRFWRGGRRWQKHKKEKQRPPLCPHGGGVLPLWSQVGMVDDPPHAQPQVWDTQTIPFMSPNPKSPFRFRSSLSSVLPFFFKALTKRIMSII